MNLVNRNILIGLVVVLAVSGFFYYQNKPEEFKLITDEEEMTKFVMTHTQEELDEYYMKVDELKANDVYGGETPEETLRMYVDALKVGNVELASKYFRLEDQKNELDELSELTSVQINNSLNFIDVEVYQTFCSNTEYKCEINVVFEEEDILIARLVRVEQSGLWKLESL